MVRCGSNITLGDLSFDFVVESKVKHGWRTLTNTAEVTLPRDAIYAFDMHHKRFDDIVKRGDAAIIAFGYDDRITIRFKGYVTGNKPGMPMTIYLEDEMFQNKETSVDPKIFPTGTHVTEVMKYLGISDFVLIGDITILGDFSISRREDTVSKALLKLKEAIHLPIFYRTGVLHVGDPYLFPNPNVVNLKFGYNIIENNLEFKHAEDIKIKVRAISNKRNGKKLKVELGDKDGELHTLNFGDLPDTTALITEAKKYIGKLKYTGFRGKVKLFGEPVIMPGDIANFLDDENEITGMYWVDAVEITNGLGGIRQDVTIGVIADSGQNGYADDYVNNIKVLNTSIDSGDKRVTPSQTPDTGTFGNDSSGDGGDW